ncbi:acetylornithine deacetylase [Gluconobacter roseus]|uniref:Acetylornithine deacetylase n=1 Tax=Gluconobacter roseus NBRC 3990 TaxID=1307950 RepID=A0A4Y3M5Z0_9PROT|nr:acetylornithine deacetylase [Gluconobacter roseus]KXV44399.1 acetylornithine deacetylase [Gluconobacter roseus]GBR47987.1 acetylornithine deacetylase ArgE [Gluconobacter roseus NBRC 3990]GEB03456.1 acetylornithine deacetylase [Gluconobacter roseus NBRC 3990]GLP93912.1 acetylornithine deacetylase [Gluconobacter roseus NBRC 3990]
MSVSEIETILSSLVGFPSVCGLPNGEIIDWIEAHLLASGARIRRVPGDAPGRYSLFAAVGPQEAEGIVLSAHADVVPVTGQDWSSDPFVLTRRENRLYGRGSSDMKGFLACMLHLARKAGRKDHPPLKRPLYLAISHDEELGCLGVRSLIEGIREDGDLQVAGCIVGEPTGMQVAVAHKGKIAFEIICRGQAAHSANPFLGKSAITLASNMVEALSRLQEHIRQTERHDGRFEVPFSTVQAGLISGGAALNIVPDLCTITAELRLLPGYEDAPYLEWLENASRKAVENLGGGEVELRIINSYPGLNASPSSDICSLALHEAGRNQVSVIDFGTEAGLLGEKLGMDCIVCGPGSIARAHKADEYITLPELADAERFLNGVLEHLRR